MPHDDPAEVRRQYACEDNLRARQALYEEVTGQGAPDALWRTLVEWQPRQVLEVGGGPGELAERLQRELGATVSFVDISPRMVELARLRGVDGQVGDIQQLPFDDGVFDTVVAAWMLYHVPDLDRGLAEVARVLKPGGALIAVTNSVHHLEELRTLISYPENWSETFSRENGESLLGRHFSHIDRFDTETVVTVRDRAKLVAYRDSMTAETEPIPEDLKLPFVVHGRSTIFVATT
ncbi:MAG TPA: class I SAM-dependent methyltransferase [Gaiellaceae bacterium]|jgi:SAM-dependent methyltransferase|nr:class I SAM-dependent methyltransferase [Gaiellaceae bacterium]